MTAHPDVVIQDGQVMIVQSFKMLVCVSVKPFQDAGILVPRRVFVTLLRDGIQLFVVLSCCICSEIKEMHHVLVFVFPGLFLDVPDQGCKFLLKSGFQWILLPMHKSHGLE